MGLRRIRNIVLLALLVVIGAAVYKGGGLALYAITPFQSSDSKSLLVLIKPGQNTEELARLLRDEGITSNSRRFHAIGRYLRFWRSIKAGEYEVTSAMTPIEIFKVFASGKSVDYSITFQEGINLYQIASLIESKGLAKAPQLVRLAKDSNFLRSLGFKEPLPPSLEGYLYPETYFLNRTMDERAILKLMYRRFQNVWKSKFAESAAGSGMNRHQIVTLASIIEKETGAPEERPTISSVFHNRLKKRMRLQSDPTTIYGIWENFNGNLRKKHLKQKTAFNTYAISGLPIGPISNPGALAIQAALNPIESPYLYFVSRNDGTHKFSRTFKEHNEAVRQYQLNRKARQGKSWRDLKKRQEARK